MDNAGMFETMGAVFNPNATSFAETLPDLFKPFELEKGLGWKELELISQRSYYGIKNKRRKKFNFHTYASGRALSPSSLKQVQNSGMEYIDYCLKPDKDEFQRFMDMHESRSRALMVGQAFEDLLFYGPAGFRKRYELFEEKKMMLKHKEYAWERGINLIRKDDQEKVFDMYKSIKRKSMDLVKKIRSGKKQVQTRFTHEQRGFELSFNGFCDSATGLKPKEIKEKATKHGFDVKTVNEIGNCEHRITQMFGQFQYWIQAALYSKALDLDHFSFVYVSKQESHPVVIYTFDKENLDKMWYNLCESHLEKFLYYLENGFTRKYNKEVNLATYDYEIQAMF